MADAVRPVVVRLPAGLGRRAQRWIERHPDRYDDLSELVRVALENQLALEGTDGSGTVDAADAAMPPSVAALVARPPSRPPVRTSPPHPSGQPLSFMTNRLNPMALAVRVLVNASGSGREVGYDDFVALATQVCRAIGTRLALEDAEDGTPQSERRATGWPIGDDAAKARLRFRRAFLVNRPGHRWAGPMAELGLVTLDGDIVVVTDLGHELAVAPSALLGETEGRVLGRNQQEILRRALMVATGERTEIARVVKAIDAAGGSLDGIDHRIQRAHRGWSTARVVAHRAAMVGRLRDAGVVTVTGRGSSAVVSIVPGTVRV